MVGQFTLSKTFQGLILHAGCPFDYCVNTPVSVQLDNLDAQCSYNHSGTQCGSCKYNHSIVFGTLHCHPCNDIYIALLIPIAFAGIVLVAILLLLNLSVANGTLMALSFMPTSFKQTVQHSFLQTSTAIFLLSL